MLFQHVLNGRQGHLCWLECPGNSSHLLHFTKQLPKLSRRRRNRRRLRRKGSGHLAGAGRLLLQLALKVGLRLAHRELRGPADGWRVHRRGRGVGQGRGKAWVGGRKDAHRWSQEPL